MDKLKKFLENYEPLKKYQPIVFYVDSGYGKKSVNVLYKTYLEKLKDYNDKMEKLQEVLKDSFSFIKQIFLHGYHICIEI